METNKVIAGPAGHWYALHRYQGQDDLIGLPMNADEDKNNPPVHPNITDNWLDWYEITDPAPETNVDELVKELRA